MYVVIRKSCHLALFAYIFINSKSILIRGLATNVGQWQKISRAQKFSNSIRVHNKTKQNLRVRDNLEFS